MYSPRVPASRLPRCPGCGAVWEPGHSQMRLRCNCGATLRINLEHRRAAYRLALERHERNYRRWDDAYRAWQRSRRDWERDTRPSYERERRREGRLRMLASYGLIVLLATVLGAPAVRGVAVTVAMALGIALALSLRVMSRRIAALEGPVCRIGAAPIPPPEPLGDDEIVQWAEYQAAQQQAWFEREADRRRREEQELFEKRGYVHLQQQMQQQQARQPR